MYAWTKPCIIPPLGERLGRPVEGGFWLLVGLSQLLALFVGVGISTPARFLLVEIIFVKMI